MKSFVLNLLASAIFLAGPGHAPAARAAQGPPPPPPPPARDYSPKTWEEFTSKEGGFRVRFPGKPLEATSKQAIPNGEIEVHSLRHDGLLRYELTYVDFAAQGHSASDVRKMLDVMKEGVVGALATEGGRVVAERGVTVDGNPGSFVHAEADGKLVFRFQWVAVGPRLYVLSVSGRKASSQELGGDGDYEEIAMAFINSFRVAP